MAPTYRQRLRVEGAWLAALGVAGSIALLATTEQAEREPWNTAGQLAAVAGLVGWLAPRATRKALNEAVELQPDAPGSGEPTPLWMHPLIVAGLVAVVVVPHELGVDSAGWDAALRITGGCTIVGLGQAVLLNAQVKRAEEKNHRRYYRIVGSQGFRTRLGWTPTTTS